ncbi:P-type conjugative transfer ATPase TrbB [Candidatus Wolfebacteria bacterium]|nr:MAG: P-type conjugative transfer ATPase TrbB [Candidatus Wolfebacteria bacterium]
MNSHKTTLSRQRAMLQTAMAPNIGNALADKSVIEVMANPDGSLWLDKHGEGRVRAGDILAADAERIIRLVASHIHLECNEMFPVVSAELPETGERFEGLLPPVVASPCFAIRKPAGVIYRLADYVNAQIMTPLQARYLKSAVEDKKNILVVGGTSSGKTTLTNALLAELADLEERIVIIEDTRELHCPVADLVSLRTKPDVASLSDLVRSTMRLRPDRIIIGEVRGPEALDMLKAWNTGHPGGIATLHANGTSSALYRLEQLIQEAVISVPKRLIADAVDVILFIKGRGDARRVDEIREVTGLDAGGDYRLRRPAELPPEPKS